MWEVSPVGPLISHMTLFLFIFLSFHFAICKAQQTMPSEQDQKLGSINQELRGVKLVIALFLLREKGGTHTTSCLQVRKLEHVVVRPFICYHPVKTG